MTHGVTEDDNLGTNSSIESSETKTDADTTALLSEALDLTNFQLSQLAIAVGTDKCGQEILEELNAAPRENNVTHGRLYPNLDTLVNRSLVEKEARDRRTYEYTPTEKGEALLSAYLGWLDTATTTDDRVGEHPEEIRRLSFEMTHFQIASLVVLHGADNAIGQDAKDGLENVYGCEINHGRLYPNLDALVELGLVEKEAADRRSFTYTLTVKGRSVIGARWRWLAGQINGGGE